MKPEDLGDFFERVGESLDVRHAPSSLLVLLEPACRPRGSDYGPRQFVFPGVRFWGFTSDRSVDWAGSPGFFHPCENRAPLLSEATLRGRCTGAD